MPYVRRLVDAQLGDVLPARPVALLLGPREVGKSTAARRLAGTVIALDDPAQAAQFRANPDTALAAMRRLSIGPLLIDEWQEAPEVLPAVRQAVHRGAPPGSFLLTGSVRSPMSAAPWLSSEQVATVTMNPVTVLERRATGIPRSGFLPGVLAGAPADITLPADVPNLRGYLKLAAAGGYPQATGTTAATRKQWWDGYLDRVAPEEVGKDRAALRRLLRALVEHAGTPVTDSALAAAARVSVTAARRQQRLLEDRQVVTVLPAWRGDGIGKLAKQPHRYVVDSGLAAAVVGTAAAAHRTRILHTFVLGQLRSLVDAAGQKVAAYHLRRYSGRQQIDVVLEAADGAVAAIAIATSADPPEDATHLGWLRDQLGQRFVAGVVLHTGRAVRALGDRITALPIATLWG